MDVLTSKIREAIANCTEAICKKSNIDKQVILDHFEQESINMSYMGKGEEQIIFRFNQITKSYQ